MKKIILILTVLVITSCARVPIYGTNKVAHAGCDVLNNGEVRCYPTPTDFESSRLFEMTPIDRLGTPPPPSMEY